jgi:hypothetical protein
LGWYFTDISVENIQNIAIGFANIDDEATVFVNGLPCGSHSGAGQPVKLVISSALRPGSNRIAVRVKDFGGPGGLLGDVSFWTFKDPADLRVYQGKEQSPAPPDWAVGAVIYEVNLRQFTNAGTVCAFADHLPRLREMGVDVLCYAAARDWGEEPQRVLGSPIRYATIAIQSGIGSLEIQTVVVLAPPMDFRVITIGSQSHGVGSSMIEELRMVQATVHRRDRAAVADWSDVADINYDAAELHARWSQDALVDSRGRIDGFR